MSHKPDVKSLFKAARAQRESTGPAKLVCLQHSSEGLISTRLVMLSEPGCARGNRSRRSSCGR